MRTATDRMTAQSDFCWCAETEWYNSWFRTKEKFLSNYIKLLKVEQVSLFRRTVLQNTSSVSYGKMNDDTGSI